MRVCPEGRRLVFVSAFAVPVLGSSTLACLCGMESKKVSPCRNGSYVWHMKGMCMASLAVAQEVHWRCGSAPERLELALTVHIDLVSLGIPCARDETVRSERGLMEEERLANTKHRFEGMMSRLSKRGLASFCDGS